MLVLGLQCVCCSSHVVTWLIDNMTGRHDGVKWPQRSCIMLNGITANNHGVVSLSTHAEAEKKCTVV